MKVRSVAYLSFSGLELVMLFFGVAWVVENQANIFVRIPTAALDSTEPSDFELDFNWSEVRSFLATIPHPALEFIFSAALGGALVVATTSWK